MKKKSIPVLAGAVFASVVAFAADRNMTYVPKAGTGPWEWNDKGNWYERKANNNAASLQCVPYSGEFDDIVWLFASPLSDAPLQISEGTVALCKQMRIGAEEVTINGVEPSTRPIWVKVCGGVVTNFYASYLGYYKDANKIKTRSAKIDIDSGSWTSLGDYNIGGGGEFSWLNVGENGFLEVTAASKSLNLGFANHGGVIVTNKGTVLARNVNVALDYEYKVYGGYATGIVHNAGSLVVTNELVLGSATNAFAHVENLGDIAVSNKLYLGSGKGSFARIDNRGNLFVANAMYLGRKAGSQNSIYRHLDGATLDYPKNKNVYFHVGQYAPAVFSVDGGELNLASSNRVYIAGYEGAADTAGTGIVEVVNGGKIKFDANSITVGLGTNSKGTLLVDGEGSEIKGSLWINVGNWASLNADRTSGRGDVIVSNGGKIDANSFYLGFGGGAVGTLTVTNGGTVRAYGNLNMGHSTGAGKSPSKGVVTVAGANSVITNVKSTLIGRIVHGNIANTGLLKMEGGSYFFQPVAGGAFNVGTNGNTSLGEIRGWGRIAHDGLGTVNPSSRVFMNHCGKVIADGEGEERDLDMRFMWSLGENSEEPNLIGCNGWYARNKGRLRMPFLYKKETDHWSHCVGDYVYHSGKPRLVNSFKYTVNSKIYSSQHQLWADLYAPDRSDIPAGLASRIGPGKALAVYRMGYLEDLYEFGEPKKPHDFIDANIMFHYSPEEAKEYPRVRVYRHDGAQGSGWRLVGEAECSADDPYVTTSQFTPIEGAVWNFGWFAVVADQPRGMAVVVR